MRNRSRYVRRTHRPPPRRPKRGLIGSSGVWSLGQRRYALAFYAPGIFFARRRTAFMALDPVAAREDH